MTEKLAKISIEKGDLCIKISKLEAQVEDSSNQIGTFN
jgi:hypothetical protein